MSTKSSLVFIEWSENKQIHIYLQMMDGCYYIETENNRLKIPEKYAKQFAEILKKDEEVN